MGLQVCGFSVDCIRHDTIKLLRLSRQFEPDDILVFLIAPTGIAAMNISGMTLHSALLLGTSKTSFHALSQEKPNTLRLKLSKLKVLIIDEISQQPAPPDPQAPLTDNRIH